MMMMMMMMMMIFFLPLTVTSWQLQISQTLTTTSPLFFNVSSVTESCCSSESTLRLDKERRKAREIINSNYNLRPQNCGGPGWIRAYYLNMADPRSSCPSNWKLYIGNIRACTRSSETGNTCNSVAIPVNRTRYSFVCGRIYAYQRDSLSGFYNSVNHPYSPNFTVNEPYVSGLSLTHGQPGHRKHIWSFAGAWDETSAHTSPAASCPCINSSYMWPYKVPSFVGNDYFCDTGTHAFSWGIDWTLPLYTDNPLWDGEGCEEPNTCCSFNNPPWFYKKLNNSTSDNLELRLCSTADSIFEDKAVSLVEVYIR